MKKILLFLFSIGGISFAQNAPVKLPSSATQIVVDSHDNLIAHCYMGRIVKISPDGRMTMITGDIQKGFRNPYPQCDALAIDNLYIIDSGNNCTRKLSASIMVSTTGKSLLAVAFKTGFYLGSGKQIDL